MRFYLFLTFAVISNYLNAQHSIVELSIPIQEIKKKTIPFYFTEIIFSKNVSDTIGIIATNKNKGNTVAIIKKNRAVTILNYLNAQFEENKKTIPVLLQITKLKLAASEKGIFSHKDTFQFQCEFYGYHNNEKTMLYSFNAKNPFGTFENAENVMSNYIGRALISAVEKFKLSFEKNTDWLKEVPQESNAEKKPVKTNAVLNKMVSKDSIPCTFLRNLTWEDFQENPAANKTNNKGKNGSGSAKFILTYQATAEETSKNLKIDIQVKAFFYKGNSWKPMNERDNDWLVYQQGHFDLCSIYGTKLYDDMKNYNYSLGAYKSELNRLYNDLNAGFMATRKQYQTETEDGKNKNQMLLWQKKIDDLVKANEKK